jgi:hypothetical protein
MRRAERLRAAWKRLGWYPISQALIAASFATRLRMAQDNLVERMVMALYEAETRRARVDSAYQRHSVPDREAQVRATLKAGRDSGLLVVDILGGRSQPPR